MSWDDVVIGEGDKGCSAMHVFELKGYHSISQNKVSYWISECIFDVGMTIFKNTPEGGTLSEMIAAKDSLESIMSYLKSLIYKYIDYTLLEKKIDAAMRKEYLRGKSDQQAVILDALGLS